MIQVCELCKNDGYFAEVIYNGKSVGELKSGNTIHGWDTWLERRYGALRFIEPDLPEYGKLDPFDTEVLEIYAKAMLSEQGMELANYSDRLVLCQCETGRKIKEEEEERKLSYEKEIKDEEEFKNKVKTFFNLLTNK